MDFDDGTKRELYKIFFLSESEPVNDVRFLNTNGWGEKSDVSTMNDLREHLAMLVSNFEATLRSEYEGIVNVRANCVGLMRVN